MKNIKIIIATHKEYNMPTDDIYMPLQVGAALHETIGYAQDNVGENISEKNKNYCELTGLYWAWKNVEADYLGLVHYRRHFACKELVGKKEKRIANHEDIEKYLDMADIVLPRQRNYYIESNYAQYIHAHHKADLEVTRKVLKKKYPDYVEAFDTVMKRTYGHRFNMMILKKEYFNSYCEWLFDILFAVEKKLDISEYSDYDSRVFGFVSERLLDVWLEKNGYKYEDVPYVFMEKQNWVKKAIKFIVRKNIHAEKL